MECMVRNNFASRGFFFFFFLVLIVGMRRNLEICINSWFCGNISVVENLYKVWELSYLWECNKL